MTTDERGDRGSCSGFAGPLALACLHPSALPRLRNLKIDAWLGGGYRNRNGNSLARPPTLAGLLPAAVPRTSQYRGMAW